MIQSLKMKLLVAMTLLISLVILTISYAIVTNQRQATEIRAQNELVSLNELIATNALSTVIFGDSLAAQSVLQGLNIRPDMVSALIFDSSSQLFASYQREDRIDMPESTLISSLLAANQAYSEVDKQGLHSYMPMNSDGETVGIVYLSNDLSSLKAHLNRFYRVVASTALLAFLASFILMFWLQAMFTKPLYQLLKVIQGITETKDYSQRAPKGNTLEFNVLAENFNSMLLEVDQRGEQLQSINTELEQRVQERTEELEHALQLANEGNRAKTEFLAVMSHEVRTPLNGIVGFSELLKMYEFDEDVKDTIDMLNDSSQSLLSLLNEILDFSKLDANKVELEKREFNLNSFMRSVVETNRSIAVKNKLELQLELATEEDSYYLGDSLRLRQVLNNLLSNAVKFSQQGEIKLRVESEAAGSEMMIGFHVTDSGIGIDATKLDAIFSPFTQADSSVTRQYGGTGLGLAICKQLIELMQGTYGLDSEVDKGSHFWFKIPLSQVSVFPEKNSEAPIIVEGSEPFVANLLIAEDNPVNQLVVKSLLETFGHQCDVVANGLEALDKTKEKHYDLILMDYHMPIMDGVLATKFIRQQTETSLNSTTPIIALTADIQPEVSKKFRRAGANDTLLKPFTREKLAQQLTKWLHTTVKEELELNCDEHAILDMTVLDGMSSLSSEGDVNIVQQVVGLYLENSPKLIKQMHQAFEDKDHDALFKAAHSLKSSSANIGVMCVSETAKQIEHLSRDGDIENTHVLLDLLDEHYQKVKRTLDEKIAEYL